MKPSIAIIIPCYQEEGTIAQVVRDFKLQLPDASLIVFDNNCTDRTAEFAKAAGAEVISVPIQGKGHVVDFAFRTVKADIYVMVDGDATYPANQVFSLLNPVISGATDMAVGYRKNSDDSLKPLHQLGNRLLCWCINTIFKSKIADIFSGYRVFSSKCVNQLSITSHGFDIETEITLQALYRGLRIQEIEVDYYQRPAGSHSKLKTISDGSLVLIRAALIVIEYKPLTVFGSAGLLLALASLLIWGSAFLHPTIPLFLLATLASLSALIFLAVGIIIHCLNTRQLELERRLTQLR